jgi:hypothetical protein
MILHTMALRPFWLPAGSLIEMTLLGPDDTNITTGQGSHAGEAVALIKAFICDSITVDAVNPAIVAKLELPPDQWI